MRKVETDEEIRQRKLAVEEESKRFKALMDRPSVFGIFEDLYKKSLKIKAFQFKKIESEHSREEWIQNLIKVHVSMTRALKELDFEQYESGETEQFLLDE